MVIVMGSVRKGNSRLMMMVGGPKNLS